MNHSPLRLSSPRRDGDEGGGVKIQNLFVPLQNLQNLQTLIARCNIATRYGYRTRVPGTRYRIYLYYDFYIRVPGYLVPRL